MEDSAVNGLEHLRIDVGAGAVMLATQRVYARPPYCDRMELTSSR